MAAKFNHFTLARVFFNIFSHLLDCPYNFFMFCVLSDFNPRVYDYFSGIEKYWLFWVNQGRLQKKNQYIS
jgi:hypothetical protein